MTLTQDQTLKKGTQQKLRMKSQELSRNWELNVLLTLLCLTLLCIIFGSIIVWIILSMSCIFYRIETASEMVIDQYNYIIQQGEKCIVCKYLAKLKEKHGCIYYKSLPKTSYVLPAQVLCSLVMLNENLFMLTADY